jgi:hypothetical protein
MGGREAVEYVEDLELVKPVGNGRTWGYVGEGDGFNEGSGHACMYIHAKTLICRYTNASIHP